MENPGVRRVGGIFAVTAVGPLIDVQRLGVSDQLRQHLLVFLVRLIFDANVVGGTAHPIGDRHVGIVRHLFAFGDHEVGGAVVVKVLADEVNVVEAVLEHVAGPVAGGHDLGNQVGAKLKRLLGTGHGVRHCAAGDQHDGGVHFLHDLSEQVVLVFELIERHVPILVAAPHLVADAPELDVIWLGMAVGGAQFAYGSVGGAIDVFDILGGGIRAAHAGIDSDISFHAKKLAHGHELFGADVVGLQSAPDGVHFRRTLVGVADSVAPFERGNVIAAGPAVNTGAKALEGRDRVGAEPVEVIGVHEGNRAGMEGTGSGAADFKLGRAGLLRFEREREFLVRRGERTEGDSLAGAGIVGVPNDADGDLRGGVAGQLNAAVVGER